jgi:hypothetical protein
MQVIDFSRSFVTMRLDLAKKSAVTFTHKPVIELNNARIQLECRCAMADKQSDWKEEFVLGASCKTERVGVDRDIWVQPNADFAPIFSHKRFVQIKTYDRADRQMAFYPPTLGVQSAYQYGMVEDGFDNLRIDVRFAEAELLKTTEEIIDATLRNNVLVAVTELETDRYKIALEYPIKTMNASERDNVYQTDTGPVLLPNFDLGPEEIVQDMRLAYSAFNDSNWIEFIARDATEAAPGVSVHHYCRSERFLAKNQVLRLKL